MTRARNLKFGVLTYKVYAYHRKKITGLKRIKTSATK